MKIATYNVNSINARIENLVAYLQTEQPDIMLLQEIKCEFNAFPFFDIQALGYDVKMIGQKSYNGVAILSTGKITVMQENLPDFDDTAARYLEADVVVANQKLRVASVYLPNGNPTPTAPDDNSKLLYKLRWQEAFYNHARSLLSLQQPVILGGDYNVIISDNDVYDSKVFQNNALCHKDVRARLKAFFHLGYFDAFRCLYPDLNGYTFWDYAGAALQNDLGMRIDYLMCNAVAFDNLHNIEVNKSPRISAKPSDHTVLQAELF